MEYFATLSFTAQVGSVLIEQNLKFIPQGSKRKTIIVNRTQEIHTFVKAETYITPGRDDIDWDIPLPVDGKAEG